MEFKTPEMKSLKEKEVEIRRPGNTKEGILKAYSEWTKDTEGSNGYDVFTSYVRYEGPEALATALASYLPDKKDVKILDVGAGTGHVGKQLKDRGFSNMDALDPSGPMLEVAKKKNIYQNHLCTFFTNHVEEIKTNTYDVLVSSGCLIEGHLKCDILPEMIRVVKTGGLILLVSRENDIFTVPELKDRLEPHLKQLEEEGQWTRLERRIFPGYHANENINGILFVFKITK